MLPLLNLAADRQPHTLRDAATAIAERMNLPQEDLEELIPSGKKTRFYDRVGWACTYLRKAGLLVNIRRGIFQITERGLAVLRENPERVDREVLSQFDEFRDFDPKSERRVNVAEVTPKAMVRGGRGTPLEDLEAAFSEIEQTLAEELLEKVRSCSPSFFEKLVVDLLVAMGYGGSLSDVSQVLGRSGDGGIDGAIKEDRLGLDTIYVQAKRWEGAVGRPEIQKFAGALDGVKARKGVFITTSRFTPKAEEYSSFIDKKIVLIDGEKLATLAIEYNLGVSTYSSYVIKRLDSDYFIED